MLSRLFFCILIVGCNAFSRGPPWKMCSLKIPKHHGLQQQSSPPPYEIILSRTTYSPGDNITVTLKGKTDTDFFRGFVIGAHPAKGDTEDVVGKFVKMPIDSKGMSWYAASENEPNCVSHNSNSDKTEVSFLWQAPPVTYGELKFIAAVAKNFKVFWANLTSKPLTTPSTSVPPFSATIQWVPGLSAIADQVNGCGNEHGCILYPRYCKGTGCEIIVTFAAMKKTSTIAIKMMGLSSAYLSLAVSDDKRMGSDFTITCTVTKDKAWPSLQNGYNPAYNNERHRVYNYSKVRLHYADHKVFCSFQRPLNITITRVKVSKTNVGTYSEAYFDLREPRYVFLAAGSLYEGTDVLYRHEQEPIITDGKVDFMSNKVYYATALPILVQLHASCMLIAWMFLAGVGMILAANFKEIIVRMVLGAKLWFQLHRTVMTSTAVFSLLGLILILVYGWRDRSCIHGALGLVVIIMCGVQIAVGVMRPDVTHRRRIVFNWVHFLIGNGLNILAAITFISALLMPHLPYGMRRANLVVVICWICVQVAWVVLFRVVRAFTKKENPVEKDNQLQMEPSNKGPSKVPKVMLVLLLCYIVTMATFFAVCITYVTIY